MKCVEVKELLETFLDGEINHTLSNKIELHLDLCQLCRLEFDELKIISKTLKKELPVSASQQLDENILTAFHQHYQKKSVWHWSPIWSRFLVLKPAFVILTLCFLTGLAFLLGRLTASKEEVVVSTPPIIKESSPTEIIKYVEVPTVKYIEIPVEKEKIIRQTIYRNIDAKDVSKKETQFARNLPDKTNSVNTENSQSLDLKDFQPVGEITPKVLKKGEMNEK